VPTPKASKSPYYIKDFTTVGNEYGTLADLRALVESAHRKGMAVIPEAPGKGKSAGSVYIW
jgi:glycosidase